jgi:hypothetical protein
VVSGIGTAQLTGWASSPFTRRNESLGRKLVGFSLEGVGLIVGIKIVKERGDLPSQVFEEMH